MECLFPNILQHAPGLEYHIFQTLTTAKCLIFNDCYALWNRHALDRGALKPLLSDFQNTVWNRNILLSPEIPEKHVADHRSRWEDCNMIHHIFPDVERTAIFDPDCSKAFAVAECIFVHLFKCTGERDLFYFAAAKTLFADVLNAVLDLNAFENPAALERSSLETLQRGRDLDALYLSFLESLSFVLSPVHNFLLPELLQALIQLRAPQLFAQGKCFCADLPHACWKNDLFTNALLKASNSDLLEPVGELDILQTSAVRKRPFSYRLQPAFLLEHDLLKVPAVFERALLNLCDTLRDDDLFDCCV